MAFLILVLVIKSGRGLQKNNQDENGHNGDKNNSAVQCNIYSCGNQSLNEWKNNLTILKQQDTNIADYTEDFVLQQENDPLLSDDVVISSHCGLAVTYFSLCS